MDITTPAYVLVSWMPKKDEPHLDSVEVARLVWTGKRFADIVRWNGKKERVMKRDYRGVIYGSKQDAQDALDARHAMVTKFIKERHAEAARNRAAQ